MIKWPLKLYVRFLCFNVFFQNPKKHEFLRFLSCCTRFIERRSVRVSGCVCVCVFVSEHIFGTIRLIFTIFVCVYFACYLSPWFGPPLAEE